MSNVNNKLGLTEAERTVYYYDANNEKKFAEIRQYDPTYGLAKLHDPMLNTQIEFLWDAGTSTWKGTGVHSGYTTEVTIEELTPLAKQDDADVPDKATTVSRDCKGPHWNCLLASWDTLDRLIVSGFCNRCCSFSS